MDLTPTLKASPEALEVANAYLETQDVHAISKRLSIPVEIVNSYLNRREIKSYINQVFFDIGYNNRFKLRAAMDALILKKFEEMQEAQRGSSKDIADLLALSHKMSMDLMDREIQIEKMKEANIRNQTNIQINNTGANYTTLLNKLLEDR